MAVPAKPAAGAAIESAWGDIVHDEVVAQDIQAGVVTVAAASTPTGSAAVVFPRPFAAAPVVVVTQAGGASGWYSYSTGVTATGFTAVIAIRTGAAGTTSVPVHWIAYGPRT
jgi:hypothetical protein